MVGLGFRVGLILEFRGHSTAKDILESSFLGEAFPIGVLWLSLK